MRSHKLFGSAKWIETTQLSHKLWLSFSLTYLLHHQAKCLFLPNSSRCVKWNTFSSRIFWNFTTALMRGRFIAESITATKGFLRLQCTMICHDRKLVVEILTRFRTSENTTSLSPGVLNIFTIILITEIDSAIQKNSAASETVVPSSSICHSAEIGNWFFTQFVTD